jgi:membrane protease YdiL (CAAX protease family)
MTDEIRWTTVWKRLGLFVLAFAVASTIVITPLATILANWAEANSTAARLYGDIAAAIAIVSATWVMTRYVDKRPFLTIGLGPNSAIRDLSAGLAIGTTWLGISVGILVVAGWALFKDQSGFSGAALLVAAVSVFFNVLTQQLLICGYILQTVRTKAGLATAVLVSAVLFSVLHAAAFGGAWIPPVNVFGAGLVFCMAYAVSGSLWLPIAIHFAWNLLLGPVLGLTISGTGSLGLGWNVFEIAGPEIFTGGAFGIEGGLIVTLTTAVLAMVFVLIHKRQSTSEIRQEYSTDESRG